MNVKRVGTCWNCSENLSDGNFGRQDECPGCLKETRVCRNCFFYDPLCYNSCREIQAERVAEKEKTTFCDFFRSVPPSSAPRSGPRSKKSTDTPRQAAEALFKSK